MNHNDPYFIYQYFIFNNPSEEHIRCHRKDAENLVQFPQFSKLFFWYDNYPMKNYWVQVYTEEPQHFLQQFLDKETI